jgi:hypothetical protein
VTGGIGSEVRGAVLPDGVLVSLMATGAGALLQAAERARRIKRALIEMMIVHRRAQVKKANCILMNSTVCMKPSGHFNRGWMSGRSNIHRKNNYNKLGYRRIRSNDFLDRTLRINSQLYGQSFTDSETQ